MPPSAELLQHLALSVTTMAPIWKMVATDGTTAAFAQHTRDLVFQSVTYKAAPVEISAVTQGLGLKVNNSQITGVFDSIVTLEDVEAGKWKMADVTLEYVNYLDLTMGSTGKQRGKIGRIDILNNVAYKMELRSLAAVLSQTIGELTSPVDRAEFPLSTADNPVDPATYTVNRAVTAVTSRRIFTVDGTFGNNYYRYGLATFTDGDNDGLSMEVQESEGNVLTLQLPMPSDISIGDHVDLLAGYDGTRTQNRERFDDMINFNAEPDLPGLRRALQFPE